MGKLIDFKNSKSKVQVINKADAITEILLYGPIGSSWDEDAISAKQFNDELKSLPANTKEIHLRVNSPGGSVFDGMAIYEKLKSEKSKGRKIVAYVDGVAASIASVIIMIADEIIVGDGSLVMIHKPMVGAQGNSAELEKMIVILDKIEEQMVGIYARRTGMSRIEISKALAEETWYTSAEAIDLKFADSQFEAKDILHVAASMIDGCAWMKNKPAMKSKNDIVREKLRASISGHKEFLNKK